MSHTNSESVVSTSMSTNQKALINGLTMLGIGIIVLGIILQIYDVNNIPQVCEYSSFSERTICYEGDASLRGLFLGVFGGVVMIAVTYTNRTFEKAAANT